MLKRLDLKMDWACLLLGIPIVALATPQSREYIKKGILWVLDASGKIMAKSGYGVAGVLLKNIAARPLSGRREVSSLYPYTRVWYTGTTGDPCAVYLPFTPKLRRGRMGYRVYLKDADGSLTDVTQEPGIEYTLSAQEMGGTAFHVYKASGSEFDPQKAVPVEVFETTIPRGKFFSKGRVEAES